jgi:hypothetical protein
LFAGVYEGMTFCVKEETKGSNLPLTFGVKSVKQTLCPRILYPDSRAAMYLIRRLRGERLKGMGGQLNISKYSSVNSAIEKVRKALQAKRRLKRPLSKLEAASSNSQD